MFLVMAVKKSMPIELNGNVIELGFETSGFCGMCPVFETEKDAIEWADGKAEIISVELKCKM